MLPFYPWTTNELYPEYPLDIIKMLLVDPGRPGQNILIFVPIIQILYSQNISRLLNSTEYHLLFSHYTQLDADKPMHFIINTTKLIFS